ncbi:MAG: peroxiredoxin [Patescibacteria group bacterium]|nr:peroxiredoxin [Patescibacteria group bacterium]
MENGNKETKSGVLMPLLGEKLPEVKVHTTHGQMTLPNDFKGKWFVLFSHPADFTPVCTTEFVAFAKRNNEFKKLNTELVGLSIDQVFSHIKWIQWIEENLKIKIKFPVIADDQGKISQQLGMIHPGKGTHTVRAVFVVDPKGTLRLTLYYPQEIGRNFDEILRVVRALQISDSNKVAMPADWPNSDLIGDHVIIFPPRDEKTAKKRKGKGCYDWWFCHRQLKKGKK